MQKFPFKKIHIFGFSNNNINTRRNVAAKLILVDRAFPTIAMYDISEAY